MDISGITSYLDNQDANASTNKATNVSNSIGGISANSSEEEMTEAVKSFEAFMLEQVIKNVKESMESINDDEEDAGMSQMKDFFMDSTIQELASTLVEDYGSNLTTDLVEQMKRNYGVE